MAKSSEPFWIVWNPEGPSRPYARHYSFEHAAAEAQRLALAHPGNDFFVMQASRRVSTPKVEIEDFEIDSDVPF